MICRLSKTVSYTGKIITHKSQIIIKMNWYIAKLVYQIIYGSGLFEAQFSEQLRLVQATDEVHAFTKAQRLGHKEENTLYHETEALVQWKFIDVCELILLTEMADGAEISSQTSEPACAKDYLKNIKRQSSQLLADSCNKCFHQN